jgi:hypothetical protein
MFPPTKADLDNRFAYHKPDGMKINEHEAVRELFADAAEDICRALPDSRERALALTNLEQAMFWTNAAIARMDSDGNRL